MALSEVAKLRIESLKKCIESAQRDIERCNITIKNNNARTGCKSAGEGAKATKKEKQIRIKAWREQIADIRKNG